MAVTLHIITKFNLQSTTGKISENYKLNTRHCILYKSLFADTVKAAPVMSSKLAEFRPLSQFNPFQYTASNRKFLIAQVAQTFEKRSLYSRIQQNYHTFRPNKRAVFAANNANTFASHYFKVFVFASNLSLPKDWMRVFTHLH